MKKLIVNADDFGYSRGLNQGIIDAHVNGIVTSTTMLTTMPGFEHGVKLAEENPTLGIGIHLSADLGRPVLDPKEVPSMVDEDGVLIRHKFNEYNLGINEDELYNEWCAQINKALDAGIKVTHLDSHHHAHMHKEIFPTFIKIAKEFNLPIRYGGHTMPEDHYDEFAPLVEGIDYVEHFFGGFYADKVSFETLEEQFKTNADSIEIMCHPAYLDYELYNGSSYNTPRLKELHILTSDEVKQAVKDYGYELVTYKSL